MDRDDQALKELEDYIEDWYYGEEMHRYALALGKYLFQFMDYLRAQGLSERTTRQYIDNCWCIGYLESNFGYRDEFVPGEVFCHPAANHDHEFARKFSRSKTALDSYRGTWRKLHTYTKALGHLDGVKDNSREKDDVFHQRQFRETNTAFDIRSEWQRKGGTLSDKTARKEFGLTQEEIIQAIKDGKLQYRHAAMHGNPFLKLLRSEVEALVEGTHGTDYLQKKQWKKELSKVTKDIKQLKGQLESLEKRQSELRELLGE